MRKLLLKNAVAVLGLALVLAGCSSKASNNSGQSGDEAAAAADVKAKDKGTVVVNIGTQGISLLSLSHEKGWIDEAFAAAGAEIKFTDFPSGPPHFEAIAAGHLDFGLVGNGPVIAGQAGDIDFKEIAVISDGKRGDTILVHEGSGIKDVADLKGKKVAVAKGSSSYAFVYRAAVQQGLKPSDIELIQLQPDEAQPAFQSKAVDAWAVWEPYVTLATNQGAVGIADGEKLNLASPSFAIARGKFAEEHPELVTIFLKELDKIITWSSEHPEETAKFFTEKKKVDADLIQLLLSKSSYSVEPVSEDYIKAQQETADLLFETGGIRKQIDVSKVVENRFVEEAFQGK
ncbi:aliphatic sulfonate ABC transporter substrate-binding protein [Paenibacillus vini]|uniref:aliphatic sulfonate ABC transporter substrate-binding protein n=1 Tax=Paenibacillus vini TaxID=1476024 RepID=UPI0025B65688|nr:aliphatic sulfonate ABC transporter substrate-binding protein [Paenibacillus vini]MDN4069590.1 aliphatic sulfonate ABC transporter substrate-binding protein [Paenibacillus vini]